MAYREALVAERSCCLIPNGAPGLKCCMAWRSHILISEWPPSVLEVHKRTADNNEVSQDGPTALDEHNGSANRF